MAMTKTDIRNWQDNITRTFAFGELRGERLPLKIAHLQNAEVVHRQQIYEKGFGFRVLMLAYQDLASRTLEEAPRLGHTTNAYNYALNLAAFRQLRVSFNTYESGYYLEAAAGLRSILEITMYLACVLKGHFGFQHIHEICDEKEFDDLDVSEFMKKSANHNREIGKRVRSLVYGAQSGLTSTQQEDIQVLIWTHHAHVHRNDSSLFRNVTSMIKTKMLPPLAPLLDLDLASLFCNAAVLAAWMHTRVLPYLSVPSEYSDGWKDRYAVLDDAFRTYIDRWEKPMKDAFLALINNSFTFDEKKSLEVVLSDDVANAHH